MLLATGAAFTGSAPALVAGLYRLTAVVTDGPPPAALARALERVEVALYVAAG